MKKIKLSMLALAFTGIFSAHGQVVFFSPEELDALDLSTSGPYFVEDIRLQFEVGGFFEGFRHATVDEVWNFAEDFGYDRSAIPKENAEVLFFLTNGPLGPTYVSGAGGTLITYSGGFADDGTAFSFQFSWPDYSSGNQSTAMGFITTDTSGDPYFTGHFLVGPGVLPVPEPAAITLILMPFGLGIFLVLRNIRKRRFRTKRFAHCCNSGSLTI